MCLVVFALDAHPDFWLVLGANRDEFYPRKTAPAAFWKTDAGTEIFGGRDLEKGGTWMGLARPRSLALLTNVRDPHVRREGLSRGWLVNGALEASDPNEFVRAIDRDRYPGFNLLVTDGSTLHYAREDSPDTELVSPGLHGLSNHRLDTSWPKVDITKRRLATLLAQPATPAPDAIFRILADHALAPDAILPQTGVPLDVERQLSAPFVRLPGYGTRCSTVVMWHRSGTIYFEERSWDEAGANVATVTETFA